MAMAPPLTLTFSTSQPISRLTQMAWAAKASLASMRSRSPVRQPAFSSAFFEAGMGPVPMMEGSTPAWAQETMRASGSRPRLRASDWRMSTTQAAPSLMPEALPAVTVPPRLKAGRRAARLSGVTPSRIYSSSPTTVSPLRVLTVTGVISSLKRPSRRAASALFCERAAKASCSSRVMSHCSAMFSAVMPM